MTDLDCSKCAGCGQLDNKDYLPWKYWMQNAIPRPSKIAIRLGIIKPIDCPKCNGLGIIIK